ncbi:PIR protein, putative [Plasmodium sp. gorilla clade G1]|nr:PIR protein, putative [Plasmodium sp. gorilla clade G1]
MKLHYSKILLLSLPLNILAHNKNKIYIKSHTPTTTSRVLSECDMQTSIYDNDGDMKSVKENFDRQTSQRFEEYEERMITQRQKYKEQRDKDIQKIISKDKMEKSLAEKVEKGCLMCACGLGGGVAPVSGLVSGIWYASWTNYVPLAISKAATDAGVEAAIEGLKGFYSLSKIITDSEIENFVTPTNYFQKMPFVTFVQKVDNTQCVGADAAKKAFCSFVSNHRQATLSQGAANIAEIADQTAKNTVASETAKFASQTTTYTTAIIASIVAIVVIALVMLIIYLILRYRRKKKMNKKFQYTKLLNQ